MTTLAALASFITAEVVHEGVPLRARAAAAPMRCAELGVLDMMMRRCEPRKPNFVQR